MKAVKVSVKTPRRDNIRQNKSAEKIRSIADSFGLHGQLQPILLRPDGTLEDGECRLDAAILLGWENIDAIILDEDVTAEELHNRQFASFFFRSDVDPYDQWRYLASYKAANPGMTNLTIGKNHAITPSDVTKILAASDCIPEVQEAFKAGKITKSDVYTISQARKEDQPARLAMFLAGRTRAEVEASGRPKKPAQPTERTPKLEIPLTSGQVVLVKGDGSLEDALEAVHEAGKMIKFALGKNYGAKTAMAMWRDATA